MSGNLINRQDAIDSLTEIIMNLKNVYGDMGSAVNGARECIKNLPSAKPDQKKGKWQCRKDEDCWECSECHAVLENSDIENHNYYYCYYCGANMMDIYGYMDLEKANYE